MAAVRNHGSLLDQIKQDFPVGNMESFLENIIKLDLVLAQVARSKKKFGTKPNKCWTRFSETVEVPSGEGGTTTLNAFITNTWSWLRFRKIFNSCSGGGGIFTTEQFKTKFVQTYFRDEPFRFFRGNTREHEVVQTLAFWQTMAEGCSNEFQGSLLAKFISLGSLNRQTVGHLLLYIGRVVMKLISFIDGHSAIIKSQLLSKSKEALDFLSKSVGENGAILRQLEEETFEQYSNRVWFNPQSPEDHVINLAWIKLVMKAVSGKSLSLVENAESQTHDEILRENFTAETHEIVLMAMAKNLFDMTTSTEDEFQQQIHLNHANVSSISDQDFSRAQSLFAERHSEFLTTPINSGHAERTSAMATTACTTTSQGLTNLQVGSLHAYNIR